jgi:hypothetical protein
MAGVQVKPAVNRPSFEGPECLIFPDDVESAA